MTSDLKKLGVTFKFISSLGRDAALVYIKDPTRLVVIPSLTENYPGTVFECIEVGVAFIASSVGGIPEMIHPDDRDETLFRPMPHHLASKLLDRLQKRPFDINPVRHAVQPTQIRSNILSFHNRIYSERATRIDSKSSRSPKVTVCVTHYERPTVLFESLVRIRDQTYSNFDVIVVDDGSASPETRRILNEIIAPLLHLNGWKLVIANHAYLGAARNRCVENTGSDVDYIFFTDEDDAIAPHALQSFVDVAEYAKAGIVTAFFHLFWGPSHLQPENESVWMFAGGSLAMAVGFNTYGGSLLLVEKQSFVRLGGFSEFDQVGHEDYEFYTKAALSGLHYEVIPRDDLLFVQKKEHSMQVDMDLPLSFFRSMSPLLKEYPELADAFMVLRGKF